MMIQNLKFNATSLSDCNSGLRVGTRGQLVPWAGRPGGSKPQVSDSELP